MLIDTSYYQHELDFSLLTVEGTIAKMSQNVGSRDPFYVSTFTQSIAHGFKYTGLYHFMDLGDPFEQLNNIERLLPAVGLGFYEPLPPHVGFALDYEGNSVMHTPPPPVESLVTMCEHLGEAWGEERVGIYTYLSLLQSLMNGPYWDRLSRHPIWLAYPGDIKVPIDNGATLWQYDIRNDVPGVNAPCLCDQIINQELIDRWFGIPVLPAPTEEEVSMLLLLPDSGIGNGVFLIDVQYIRWVQGDEYSALKHGGVREVTVSDVELRWIASHRDKLGVAPNEGIYVGLW